MARTESERHRDTLTAKLRADGALRSARVEAAFRAVPREAFLPDTLGEGGLEAVYRDDAIITKRDARGWPLSSSSQPAIMARMLELLDVQPGDRVLEVGAGTGYNAALLAHLAGPSGRVVSVDIDVDLARQARRALKEAGVRATIVAGDGRDGDAAHGPYDRIIVTASAGEVPRAWREQLRDGGRLVAPLRLDSDGGGFQVIPAFARHGATLASVGMTWGGFMPLHDGDGGSQRPSANLNAVHSVGDRHTGLASISGHGVGQLSPVGARDLLAGLLSPPGAPLRSGSTGTVSGWLPLLLPYLLLNISPKRRLSLHGHGRWGIGIVHRPSQSAAIVSLPTARKARDGHTASARGRWRLDAYGADTAASELDTLLTHWQQLNQTGRPALTITARGTGQKLRLTFTWGRDGGDDPT